MIAIHSSKVKQDRRQGEDDVAACFATDWIALAVAGEGMLMKLTSLGPTLLNLHGRAL